MNNIYYSFNDYLRGKYKEKVRKIPIDAGFCCPNRDGLKGYGGCIYCNNKAFSNIMDIDIKKQVKSGIERLKKQGVNKYIVYFQTYSNTYGDLEEIKNKVNASLIDESIVGIYIGTRPDTIDEEKLKFFESLSEKYEIFIEYGLQSMHDKTLTLINRGHSLKDFENAYYLTKRAHLKICVHVIFGLPGETKSMMLDTVTYLNNIGIDAIKFHHLQVFKDTLLEKMYHNQTFQLLQEDVYIDILSEAITKLSKHVIIARLASTANKNLLIAPSWPARSAAFINKLQQFMKTKKLYQGKNELIL